MANAAFEEITPLVSAGEGAKRRSSFVYDPAIGALVLRPDLRAKFAKALTREARHINAGIQRRLLALYLQTLLLNVRNALLKVVGDLFGKFGKLLNQ